MCEPITISATTMWVMAGVTAVAAGAAAYSAKQSGKRQVKALDEANELRAGQIAKQGGAELMQVSREARRSQGEARATASEAGINLGSNSFLALLQNSAFNASFDSGLVSYNNEEAQKGRQSEYTSRLAGINIPTNLGIGLSMAQGGMQGYQTAQSMQAAGIAAGTQTAPTK